jgi:hypothetical protein
MSRAWLRRLGRLVGCGLLLESSWALAAPTEVPRCDDDRTPRVTIKRGPHGEKRIVFQDPVLVCGRRHKPNAFYVLERARIEYRDGELERSFVPRIPRAVRHQPF